MDELCGLASCGDAAGLKQWLGNHPCPDGGIDRYKGMFSVGSALFRACLGLCYWRDADEESRAVAVRTLLACGADPNQISPPGWGINMLVNTVAQSEQGGTIFWILVDAGARVAGCCYPWTTGPRPVGSALYHAAVEGTRTSEAIALSLVDRLGLDHFAEDCEETCFAASPGMRRALLGAAGSDRERAPGMLVYAALGELSELHHPDADLVRRVLDATPGLMHMRTSRRGLSLFDHVVQGFYFTRTNHRCVRCSTPKMVLLLIEAGRLRGDAAALGDALAGCCRSSPGAQPELARSSPLRPQPDDRIPKETLRILFDAGGRFDVDDARFAWALDTWREFVTSRPDLVDAVVRPLAEKLPLDVAREIARRVLGL